MRPISLPALGLAVSLLSLGAAGGARAATVFDLESVPEGTYSSFSQTVDGLTATFAPAGGLIWVVDATLPIPGMSGHLMTPLYYIHGAAGPITANFSAPVANVAITGGDYGDDLDFVWIAAYSGLNGEGALLDSFEFGCCNTRPESVTIQLHASGVRSVQFYSRSFHNPGGDGSVLFDNLKVDMVPEPATWVEMVAGFGLVGATFRSRRRPATA